MSPTATAARAPLTRRARPSEAPARRPSLELLAPEPRRRGARRRAAPVAAAALVVGSLVAVVVGHAVLAEGQVRLSGIVSQVAAAQTANGQETLNLASLESPSRIVGQATHDLHMVSAGEVVQLPYVPLGTPVPTPTVGPAPATGGTQSSAPPSDP